MNLKEEGMQMHPLFFFCLGRSFCAEDVVLMVYGFAPSSHLLTALFNYKLRKFLSPKKGEQKQKKHTAKHGEVRGRCEGG